MALTIEKKFYADDTWKDLSKIVFTSPNMDSPNNAGTRSHVLPGQGIIGTWYEDTSNMYRVFDDQLESSRSFYGHSSVLDASVNLDSPPSSINITYSGTSSSKFYDDVRDSVGYILGGFDELTVSGTAITTLKPDFINNSYPIEDLFTSDSGWLSADFTGFPSTECWIEVEFDELTRVNRLYLESKSMGGDGNTHAFIGGYTIKAKKNYQDDFVTLISDSSNSRMFNGGTYSYLYINIPFEDSDYFKYYRVYIHDAPVDSDTGDDLVFSSDVYGLGSLIFSTYIYSGTPHENKPFYSFNDDGSADIIYVSDITDNGGGSFTLSVNSVDGSGSLSSGTVISTWGDYDNVSNSISLLVDNSVMFKVTQGEAYDCWLTAWDDATHSTVLNPVLAGDHCRVSAVAYCSTGTDDVTPNESTNPINYIFAPIHNRIFKGDTVFEGTNYYYGTFDLSYKYQTDINGDFLIFRPMLYGIDETMPYGVHDFLIVFHYSYT